MLSPDLGYTEGKKCYDPKRCLSISLHGYCLACRVPLVIPLPPQTLVPRVPLNNQKHQSEFWHRQFMPLPQPIILVDCNVLIRLWCGFPPFVTLPPRDWLVLIFISLESLVLTFCSYLCKTTRAVTWRRWAASSSGERCHEMFRLSKDRMWQHFLFIYS